MPIASGANAWPTQYFKKPPSPEPPRKVIPSKPFSKPVQPIIVREEPPPPVRPPPQPRPSPVPFKRDPPVMAVVQEPPRPVRPRKPGPCNDTCVGRCCCLGNFCYPRDPGPREGCCKYGCMAGCGGCCCTRGYWEPVDIFNETMPYNTGGCCGSPYEYNRGTKKQRCRRCCSIFLGILFPLLLIGAIIAAVILIQGDIDKQRTEAAEEVYPDGYFEDGVFYVPIQEGDTYYAVKGQPAIDMCWKAWSTLMAITPSSPARVLRTETSTAPTPIPSTTPTVPTVGTATMEEYTGTATTEEAITTTPTLPPTVKTTTPAPSRVQRFTTVTVSYPDCFALTTRIDFVRKEESRDPALIVIQNYNNSGHKHSLHLTLWICVFIFTLYILMPRFQS